MGLVDKAILEARGRNSGTNLRPESLLAERPKSAGAASSIQASIWLRNTEERQPEEDSGASQGSWRVVRDKGAQWWVP